MARFKRESRFTKDDLLEIWDAGEPVVAVSSHEDLVRALMPSGVDFWVQAMAGATTYHPVPQFPSADLTDWESLDARPKFTWSRELDPATSG